MVTGVQPDGAGVLVATDEPGDGSESDLDSSLHTHVACIYFSGDQSAGASSPDIIDLSVPTQEPRHLVFMYPDGSHARSRRPESEVESSISGYVVRTYHHHHGPSQDKPCGSPHTVARGSFSEHILVNSDNDGSTWPHAAQYSRGGVAGGVEGYVVARALRGSTALQRLGKFSHPLLTHNGSRQVFHLGLWEHRFAVFVVVERGTSLETHCQDSPGHGYVVVGDLQAMATCTSYRIGHLSSHTLTNPFSVVGHMVTFFLHDPEQRTPVVHVWDLYNLMGVGGGKQAIK
eukprot:TRINITY_DN18881_c0_g1_i1.p1 TRINITY_DN18881_c0_g1~~TRINITY_DN18881_c0_g1_i1.p1  ORF type:complete len:288 (+),score=25.51 TRINITY_DN18881_c0_g1_i1:67-930(+)